MIFVIFSRNVLGTLNLGDILSQRETIAREMQVAFLSSYFTLFCLVVFFRGFRFSVLFNACYGGPLLGDVCKMLALFTVYSFYSKHLFFIPVCAIGRCMQATP